MFYVPDVYCVRTLCVVIFALLYCLLDFSGGRCNFIPLYFLSCSVFLCQRLCLSCMVRV